MIFFTGCNHPTMLPQLNNLPFLMSVNGLLKKRGRRYSVRKKGLDINESREWILDSGAFSRISRLYGFKAHLSVKRYAAIARKFCVYGRCLAVVSQDYMCEDFILDVTGLDIPTHQKLTILRYDRLKEELGDDFQIPIMPVLQGYPPETYVEHIRQYGSRLTHGMLVGVGSVCKRNSNPELVREVLLAIKKERPDLRLHGFGLKKQALGLGGIRNLLYSSDSAAGGLWSKPKKRKTKKYENANNPQHLMAYALETCERIQLELPLFV